MFHADAHNRSDQFQKRHIGPNDRDVQKMLNSLGMRSIDDFIEKVIPQDVLSKNNREPFLGSLTEFALQNELKSIASKNKNYKSWIGLGYANCIVPSVIKRNILENPGWYTQYTPYQPEISQGRLESLLNFQTMIEDLTGLPVANASLLDEGTAAAEALLLSFVESGRDLSKIYFISNLCHPQTIDVVLGKAKNLGIEIVIGDHRKFTDFSKLFGALLQYPATDGVVVDYSDFINSCKNNGAISCLATDLLSLVLLKSPGELGADIAIGNSQRFGVPLGFGGPHAAYFSTSEKFLRKIPGRIVGVSKDAHGKKAYRLTLQTREQHIRREKATSNICTAQALLANMAAMYAVYHGASGLKNIANRVHGMTLKLKILLQKYGLNVNEEPFFDTIKISSDEKSIQNYIEAAWKKHVNLRKINEHTIGISLDETTEIGDLEDLVEIFSGAKIQIKYTETNLIPVLSEKFLRKTSFLEHEVFNKYHSETELMRYIKRLENKDLSLTHSMIPLGSCTMKLNAVSEMEPISWREFSDIHPFAPAFQTEGYIHLFNELESLLAKLTGFSAVSLQPNSGAQGEYTGLAVIKEYQKSRGESHRDICLIPTSAHGTNPASAVLAGMKVVSVECDSNGNVDMGDLEAKLKQYSPQLSTFMITYPSTHGVFESQIKSYCELVHKHGGQVYMDGANLNAQLGLCYPAELGADVCHLNLHKTFCIPHGGGGPGAGPIAVQKHLSPFLPGHCLLSHVGGGKPIHAVSSAPFGNASILPISYAYIKMMGFEGLKHATKIAILNANYIAKRLSEHYEILYKGEYGFVAHECIVDMRKFKKTCGIEVFDIAKRLMDYGFHAPTVSFPVPGTLMIEPTESESLVEIDRFCDAMISIRKEIQDIEDGRASPTDNVLKNAPHTMDALTVSVWNHEYTREKACFPNEDIRENKYWPTVSRIDEAYGDRNFMCRCT